MRWLIAQAASQQLNVGYGSSMPSDVLFTLAYGVAAWVTEYAPVASAGCAAIAAGASWTTVLLNRRTLKAQSRPELRIQMMNAPGLFRFAIYNAGGLARSPGFFIAGSSVRIFGYVGEGLLAQGQHVYMQAQKLMLRSGEDPRMVVFCDDIEGHTWAWDGSGNRKRVRRLFRSSERRSEQAWNAFFSDAPASSFESRHLLIAWLAGSEPEIDTPESPAGPA